MKIKKKIKTLATIGLLGSPRFAGPRTENILAKLPESLVAVYKEVVFINKDNLLQLSETKEVLSADERAHLQDVGSPAALTLSRYKLL